MYETTFNIANDSSTTRIDYDYYFERLFNSFADLHGRAFKRVTIYSDAVDSHFNLMKKSMDAFESATTRFAKDIAAGVFSKSLNTASKNVNLLTTSLHGFGKSLLVNIAELGVNYVFKLASKFIEEAERKHQLLDNFASGSQAKVDEYYEELARTEAVYENYKAIGVRRGYIPLKDIAYQEFLASISNAKQIYGPSHYDKHAVNMTTEQKEQYAEHIRGITEINSVIDDAIEILKKLNGAHEAVDMLNQALPADIATKYRIITSDQFKNTLLAAARLDPNRYSGYNSLLQVMFGSVALSQPAISTAIPRHTIYDRFINEKYPQLLDSLFKILSRLNDSVSPNNGVYAPSQQMLIEQERLMSSRSIEVRIAGMGGKQLKEMLHLGDDEVKIAAINELYRRRAELIKQELIGTGVVSTALEQNNNLRDKEIERIRNSNAMLMEEKRIRDGLLAKYATTQQQLAKRFEELQKDKQLLKERFADSNQLQGMLANADKEAFTAINDLVLQNPGVQHLTQSILNLGNAFKLMGETLPIPILNQFFGSTERLKIKQQETAQLLEDLTNKLLPSWQRELIALNKEQENLTTRIQQSTLTDAEKTRWLALLSQNFSNQRQELLLNNEEFQKFAGTMGMIFPVFNNFVKKQEQVTNQTQLQQEQWQALIDSMSMTAGAFESIARGLEGLGLAGASVFSNLATITDAFGRALADIPNAMNSISAGLDALTNANASFSGQVSGLFNVLGGYGQIAGSLLNIGASIHSWISAWGTDGVDSVAASLGGRFGSIWGVSYTAAMQQAVNAATRDIANNSNMTLEGRGIVEHHAIYHPDVVKEVFASISNWSAGVQDQMAHLLEHSTKAVLMNSMGLSEAQAAERMAPLFQQVISQVGEAGLSGEMARMVEWVKRFGVELDGVTRRLEGTSGMVNEYFEKFTSFKQDGFVRMQADWRELQDVMNSGVGSLQYADAIDLMQEKWGGSIDEMIRKAELFGYAVPEMMQQFSASFALEEARENLLSLQQQLEQSDYANRYSGLDKFLFAHTFKDQMRSERSSYLQSYIESQLKGENFETEAARRIAEGLARTAGRSDFRGIRQDAKSLFDDGMITRAEINEQLGNYESKEQKDLFLNLARQIRDREEEKARRKEEREHRLKLEENWLEQQSKLAEIEAQLAQIKDVNQSQRTTALYIDSVKIAEAVMSDPRSREVFSKGYSQSQKYD